MLKLKFAIDLQAVISAVLGLLIYRHHISSWFLFPIVNNKLGVRVTVNTIASCNSKRGKR